MGPGFHSRLQKQHLRPGRQLYFKGSREAGNGCLTQPRSKAQAGVIIQSKTNSSSQESSERWWSGQSVLGSTVRVNALGGQESPLPSHPDLGATILLPIPSHHHRGAPGEHKGSGAGCAPRHRVLNISFCSNPAGTQVVVQDGTWNMSQAPRLLRLLLFPASK